MIDPGSQAVLASILRRESRSLLLYVGDAFPWATASQTQELTTLQGLIHQERAAVASLGQFLLRQRVGLPFIGAYPMAFTTIHFVALDYLLPRLIEAQSHGIEQLQGDLERLVDAGSRLEVERLLAVKKRTQAGLERLVPASSPASV
ncbi:MAG: hypothetical protein U0840_15930 [Gemmataceae bacterium]